MSGKRGAARDVLELAFFRASAGFLALLPEAAAARLGGALVRLYLRFAGSRRRILADNLRAAFPGKNAAEIDRLARSSADALGRAFVEFLGISAMSAEDLQARVRVAGEEHFRAALARERGVLFLSAHFGGWELGALRASFLGVPVSVVVRPLDNSRLEDELARRRTRFGNRLTPKREAARDILRALARREIVIILVDQNVLPAEGVFVPFFGRLAATTPSLALFQLKTGAAVLPVFVWPEGGGRYLAEFEKPIFAEEFAAFDRIEAVRRATARYMEVTEAAVRRMPEAWLWLHNRWRTRPPDAKP